MPRLWPMGPQWRGLTRPVCSRRSAGAGPAVEARQHARCSPACSRAGRAPASSHHGRRKEGDHRGAVFHLKPKGHMVSWQRDTWRADQETGGGWERTGGGLARQGAGRSVSPAATSAGRRGAGNDCPSAFSLATSSWGKDFVLAFCSVMTPSQQPFILMIA